MSRPPLETRSEIEDLLSAYAIALDVDDVAGCVQLFVPDGSFHVYGRSWDGHEQLTTMMSAAPGGLHLCGRALIDLDGDRATVRSQLLFIDPHTHALRPCIYDDVITRETGEWRFESRRCQFLGPDGLADRPYDPGKA